VLRKHNRFRPWFYRWFHLYKTYGPQRVADELTRAGTLVKRSAVYNVLRRHGLTTKKQRLEYLRFKNGVVGTSSDLDREMAKPVLTTPGTPVTSLGSIPFLSEP